MIRRDLIKLLGTSLGGAILSSCGSDRILNPINPTPGLSPLPNALRYYRLKGVGDPLPMGSAIRNLRLDCVIDDTDDVLYGAIDANDRLGLYGFTVVVGGSQPTIGAERLVARTGDTTSDGKEILEVKSYDVNPGGGCAVVLNVATGQIAPNGQKLGTDVLYFGISEAALGRVLYEGFVTGDGHILSGKFGDVDTHHGHDILIVAAYQHFDDPDGIQDNDAPDHRPLQGIFLLPGGSAAQMRLVANVEDISSSSGEQVGRIGLIDMHDGQNFVVQAHPTSVRDAGGSSLRATPPASNSFLLRGRIPSRGKAQLFGSSRRGGIGALLQQGASGASVYGPRLGSNDLTAWVLHTSQTAMTMFYHGLPVISTGDRAPSGNMVLSMSPPAFGSGGEIYYALHTREGHELYATNGERQVLLLSNGDRLANDPRRVADIMMGLTTEHVDGEGRLAFAAALDDDSGAILLGVPA